MNSQTLAPVIYQLRIVLRAISPLIWRRLLVRSDTTLAQLHRMLHILFAWSNDHLYRFHIVGRDFAWDDIATPQTKLGDCGVHRGERFRYIYNFSAPWQCDIRLEATLPWEPQQSYPVCTGGQRPAPPEEVPDAWTYLALLDAHRVPPMEAILTLAEMAQAILDAPADVPLREAVGDLDAIREATARLEAYERGQPSAFQRRQVNAALRQHRWEEGPSV